MKSKIVYNGKFLNVNPLRSPKDSQQLDNFLRTNNGNRCFVRMHGNWFKVTREGKFIRVAKTLGHLTFQEWLEISIDDNFKANI